MIRPNKAIKPTNVQTPIRPRSPQVKWNLPSNVTAVPVTQSPLTTPGALAYESPIKVTSYTWNSPKTPTPSSETDGASSPSDILDRIDIPDDTLLTVEKLMDAIDAHEGDIAETEDLIVPDNEIPTNFIAGSTRGSDSAASEDDEDGDRSSSSSSQGSYKSSDPLTDRERIRCGLHNLLKKIPDWTWEDSPDGSMRIFQIKRETSDDHKKDEGTDKSVGAWVLGTVAPAERKNFEALPIPKTQMNKKMVLTFKNINGREIPYNVYELFPDFDPPSTEEAQIRLHFKRLMTDKRGRPWVMFNLKLLI